MAKRAVLTHTKFRKLCRKLDIPDYAALGILESLWHLTARECPRGDIGKLSDEDIATVIDWRGDEEALIKALVSSGWLDEHPDHRLVVHDWHEHSDDAVDNVVARSINVYASGRMPRMNKLSEKEKDRLLKSFAEKSESVRTDTESHAHDVRTESAQINETCAQHAHEERTPCALPEPSQSLEPSLAGPSQSLVSSHKQGANSARVRGRGSPKASTPTGGEISLSLSNPEIAAEVASAKAEANRNGKRPPPELPPEEHSPEFLAAAKRIEAARGSE